MSYDILKVRRKPERAEAGKGREGIHFIGEGHLDLSRKMNQVLETKEERELIELRVLILEHEVRRIKDRLEIA